MKPRGYWTGAWYARRWVQEDEYDQLQMDRTDYALERELDLEDRRISTDEEDYRNMRGNRRDD